MGDRKGVDSNPNNFVFSGESIIQKEPRPQLSSFSIQLMPLTNFASVYTN